MGAFIDWILKNIDEIIETRENISSIIDEFNDNNYDLSIIEDILIEYNLINIAIEKITK